MRVGLEALILSATQTRLRRLTDAPLQGHASVAPLPFAGNKPGMTLGVAIETVRPGPWGWTWSGGAHGNPINQRLGTDTGEETLLLWEVDGAQPCAEPTRPPRFAPSVYGDPGDATADAGAHSTWPPRRWGGNLDCKELVAGSVLYLPIGVEGARFSVGDGHGAQGDGEIGGQAIECPMEQVDLTFTLHTDFPITTPHAQIAAGWLTFGFHEDLDEATVIALNAMLDLMMGRYDCSRKEALGLASIIVDVRVTQIVNGVRGVHAFLPDTTVNEYSVT
ncbi:MAG: acetamidase/formamidase family protein [Caldilineaceae bacterium]